MIPERNADAIARSRASARTRSTSSCRVTRCIVRPTARRISQPSTIVTTIATTRISRIRTGAGSSMSSSRSHQLSTSAWPRTSERACIGSQLYGWALTGPQ
jgi:hypothetical protein